MASGLLALDAHKVGFSIHNAYNKYYIKIKENVLTIINFIIIILTHQSKLTTLSKPSIITCLGVLID